MIFTPEHEALRRTVRQFVEHDINPYEIGRAHV